MRDALTRVLAKELGEAAAVDPDAYGAERRSRRGRAVETRPGDAAAAT